MSRFFKNLYKQQKETIDDDFPELEDDKVGDNLGFKVVTNLKNDCVTFKTTGFKHPNGSDVEGTLEPELRLKDYDLVLKGKFQTSNKFESTLSLNDKLVKGATLFVTGKAEVTDKPKQSLEVGVDYINKDFGTFNLKVISPSTFDTKDIELYTAGVGHYEGVSVGVDVQLHPSNRVVSKSNGYIQYDNTDYSFALFGKYDKKKGYKVGAGHYHTLNSTTKGAVEVSVDPQSVSNTTIKVAGNHKYDEHTVLRPRLSVYALTKEVRLGFVLKQTLSSISKLTFSTDISTNSLFQEEKSFKKNQFGVTLSFFD
jgi:hypothetical protein